MFWAIQQLVLYVYSEKICQNQKKKKKKKKRSGVCVFGKVVGLSIFVRILLEITEVEPNEVCFPWN